MGRSKFYYGNGILDGVIPTASSTKQSTSGQIVNPDARGTAELILEGKFNGDETDSYIVSVVDDTVANPEAELSTPTFLGQGEDRSNDLKVTRQLTTAPAGEYRLTCVASGVEDEDSSVELFPNFNFKANINNSNSSDYDEFDISGINGNRIHIGVHCLHPSYSTCASSSVYRRPDPNVPLLIIAPTSVAPLEEDRNIGDFKTYPMLPARWGASTIENNLSVYSERPVKIPVARQGESGEEFMNYYPLNELNSNNLYEPHLQDARFVMGYPTDSTSRTRILEQVFLDRVYKEYKRNSSGSGEEYGVLGISRGDNVVDMPKGMVPYLVGGGYMIHVYLTDTSDLHVADFFYTHFPLKNQGSATYTWHPITTWGEFAFSLWQHKYNSLYYYDSGTDKNQQTTITELRQPLIELDSTVVPTPRTKVYNDVENIEFVAKTTSTVGFPKVLGRIKKLSDFKIEDRSKLNTLVSGGYLSSEVIDCKFARIDDDGTPIFECNIPGVSVGKVELTPLQRFKDIVNAVNGCDTGLDFMIPEYGSDVEVVVVSDPEATEGAAVIALKNDTPDNPRTINLCVHHIHKGASLGTRGLTVYLEYTKFTADSCGDCTDYFPDGYNPSCLDVGGPNNGSFGLGIEELVDLHGNTILTPIPTGIANRELETISHTVGFNTHGMTLETIIQSGWSGAEFYLRKTFLEGLGLADYLTKCDACISAYEDKLFKLSIVDRSGVPQEDWSDPNAPDFSLLLGAELVDGEVWDPNTQIDTFCEKLTSGCVPGFSGILYPCDDGNEYTSWETRVLRGPHSGGFRGKPGDSIWSGIKNGVAKLTSDEDYVSREYYKNYFGEKNSVGPWLQTTFLEQVNSAFATKVTSYKLLDEALRGDNLNTEWSDSATSPSDFYIPRMDAGTERITSLVDYFKYEYLPHMPSTFITGESKSTIEQDVNDFIKEYIFWCMDPGAYLELNYSGHTDYDPVFKWLYRLPSQSKFGPSLKFIDSSQQVRAKFLYDNSPHVYCMSGSHSTFTLAKVTYRYETTAYTYQKLIQSPNPTSPLYEYTEVPATSIIKTQYVAFNKNQTENTIQTSIDEAFNYSEVRDLTTYLGLRDPSPTSMTITSSVVSFTTHLVEDVNMGVTQKIRDRISNYLQTQFPTSVGNTYDWECVHFGGLLIDGLSDGSDSGLTVNRASKRGLSEKGGFHAFKAMEEIFWYKFLKILAKAGWKWDIERYIETCPQQKNYTSSIGCIGAGDGGGSCDNYYADTDYWRVSVQSELVAGTSFDSTIKTSVSNRAFTNHTYYDPEESRFAFLVATRCEDQLIYGDKITITYKGSSQTVNRENYSEGDGFQIKTYGNSIRQLTGGISDRDVAEWNFKFPTGNSLGLEDVTLYDIPNSTDAGVQYVPSNLLRGYFSIELNVPIKFQKDDYFKWSLSGGSFIVRSSNLGISTPLYLSSTPQEPFPLASPIPGVKIGFEFNSETPFQLADLWHILLTQNNAASNTHTWSKEQVWVSGESSGVYELPGNEVTIEFNLGVGNGDAITDFALVGHNLTPNQFVYLEGRTPPTATWATISGSNIPVYSSLFSGFPAPPVVWTNETGEGPYEIYRVRITDPGATLNQAIITKIFMANSNNTNSGVVMLSCNQDPFMSRTVVFNTGNSNQKQLDSQFLDVQENIVITYDLLDEANYSLLWSLIYGVKSISNSPFVWISNTNTLRRTSVLRLDTNSFNRIHRDADLRGLVSQGYYSDISLPVVAVNLNRES